MSIFSKNPNESAYAGGKKNKFGANFVKNDGKLGTYFVNFNTNFDTVFEKKYMIFGMDY